MKLYSDAALAKILDKEIFHQISAVADRLGVECYVVGGYVRDIFLERPSNDIDVVVVGSGIKVATELKKVLGRKAHLSVFKNFGTAQVKIAPSNLPQLGEATGASKFSQSGEATAASKFSQSGEATAASQLLPQLGEAGRGLEVEFVGARKESYSHDSRKPIVEDGTLEDDQNRRDFTINAMAICLNQKRFGQLIDPFNGIADLEDGIIATPLDPEVTFSDDPLRMMRCIRFATQLNFQIEDETFDALQRMAERIKIVSGERIEVELNKIMAAPHPSIGLEYLQRSGLLQIILPEVAALDIVEKREGRAHKNNFYHTLEVLENVAAPSNLPPPGEATAPRSEADIIEYYQTADPFLYDVLKHNARKNRDNPTEAEKAMWELLRGKNIGEKFRRQHVIGDFIVDFVCFKKKIVVEVDGGYHYTPEQEEADKLRTKILKDMGYHELRFKNEEVLFSPEKVVTSIQTALQASPSGGRLEGALWLRWAALLHDIGKTKSKRWEPGAGWTFHNHNIIGAKQVPTIFRRLKLPMGAEMKYVQKLVDLHMRPQVIADSEVTDSAVRRLLNDAGDDIDDLMTLCEADITSKNEVKKKMFLENFRIVREKLADLKEKDYKRLLQPVIDGNEIMELFHLQPSREVGVLKQYLKDAVLDNRVENEREPLMQLLMEKAKEMGLTA